MPAPLMPSTRPRCFSNQRVATVAATGAAVALDPMAAIRPTATKNCQNWVTPAPAMVPIPTRATPPVRTQRGPQRSASRPTNGPVSP